MKDLDKVVTYPAVFTPEKDDSSINVSFPDIPETLTFGRNKHQAMLEAKEALGLALYGYTKLPKPSDSASVSARLHQGQYVVNISINLASEFSKVKAY